MRDIFIAFYFGLLIFIALFGVQLYWLIILYLRHSREPIATPPLSHFPRVTVQLPIYNEKRVALRLIRAAMNFDWPSDKLEIQILDDSADLTSELIKRYLSRFKDTSPALHHIRRANRNGFKAGALANGLMTAKGEYIAVFDADNLPQHDFLKQTIPHFDDDRVGIVQARWSFLNRDESFLCRAQALFLDAHFGVEQEARFRGGLMPNFNGTAGVWRRTAIDSSDGWTHDTLTEDLDLSMRAHLSGWQLVYLNHYHVPTELPGSITAFKSQQYRWSKGAIQTALKLGPTILRSSLPIRAKLGAFFHFGSKLLSPALLALAISLIPALFIRLEAGIWKLLVIDLPIFVVGTASMSIFYGLAYRSSQGRRKLSDRLTLPLLTSLGIALAVNNTRALLSATLRRSTPFVRTPKSGSTQHHYRLIPADYRLGLEHTLIIELMLALYSTAAVATAVLTGLYLSLPFMITFAVGFCYFAARGLREQYGK